MGGNAFKSLHCPRVSPEIYAKVKFITTAVLQTLFTHVTVPFEIPGKVDYGDIDFLVSAPFGKSSDQSLTTFPFLSAIEAIKHGLNTPHGRRGFLTPDCMYFAIPIPSVSTTHCLDEHGDIDGESESWVQVDVKVCLKPETFSWVTFQLNYASQSGILGSMIKPLGLTLDPEGLHIRVQEMEDTDWAGSMVWITQDAWTVCRVLGLGRRVVDGGFEGSEDIYREYASSWLFHPEHFKAKLGEESYLMQHSHRSYFLKDWIPERYPGYGLDTEKAEDLQTWTKRTRTAAREEVFTMFPQVATEYYGKRAQHMNEVEERRFRDLITNAIPSGTDGWSNDFQLPRIITRQPTTQDTTGTPQHQSELFQHGELTPPPSPTNKPTDLATSPSLPDNPCVNKPWETPLYIDALPRQPPYSCNPSPPPASMSAAARLSCLARWTSFSSTGVPYLLTSPHAKDFDLQWRLSAERGLSEKGLVRWAREMWWCVWVRQCVVNWRGMWAKRFEKEDKKAERVRAEEEERSVQEMAEREVRAEAEELLKKNREKVLGRLEGLNRVLGLVGADK